MRFPVMVLSIAGSGRENIGQKLVAITIVLKKTAAHNPACNAGLWDLLRIGWGFHADFALAYGLKI